MCTEIIWKFEVLFFTEIYFCAKFSHEMWMTLFIVNPLITISQIRHDHYTMMFLIYSAKIEKYTTWFYWNFEFGMDLANNAFLHIGMFEVMTKCLTLCKWRASNYAYILVKFAHKYL